MITETKLAPHDIAAEEAALGSLLIDGDAIGQVNLRAADFYHEPHMIIYGVMRDLTKRHEAIDQITVGQELERIGKSELCGGVAYLSHLISVVPTPLDLPDYAAIVSRLSVYRQMIAMGQSITETGFNPCPELKESLDKVNSIVTNFKKHNSTFKGLVTPLSAADLVLEMVREYGEPKNSLSWGFKALNDLTGGIYPGELVVLGARPSVGKTQLMLDMQEAISSTGKTALFVSAEMTIKQILERKLARELHISVKQLREGNLGERMEQQVYNLAGRISEDNVYYLSKGASSRDIYTEVARLMEEVGLHIVFVDYLQILADCWQSEKENMNIRVGKACKELKAIATDFNIPVVLASQLNRGLEYREQKKPTLSDLRDSGSIEQDADVVLLLHRDEEDDRFLEIKMAKNRQLGQAKAVNLIWSYEGHRYVDCGTEIKQEALLGNED